MAVLGCIADDFTGASDAASFLVKGGMRVKLYNGVPEKATASEEAAQAIVIALKSRTQETDAAVEDSVNAARFLQSQGVRQLYFKYCSTFDSTPQGNIGPVCDALMNLTGSPYTLLCPSLPVNGRTVEDGRLLVNGIPLHESHMKNHPLTPMWDCRVDHLMEPQSRYRCVLMSREQIAEGRRLAGQETEPFYIIPDYVTDEDGAAIAQSFGDLPLLTGGSGLLEFLADRWTSQLAAPGVIPESASAGKALLIAGSCSKATLGQIAWYQKQGQPCYKIDPAAMLSGDQTREEIWRFILEHTTDDTAVLAYSSDTPERVKEYQSLGQTRVASLLEDTAAWLAQEAVKAGFTRIISAGGETSGAVTKGLHFSSYWMGESVAPGVPIMVPAERDDIRLILKSGNFGQEDFFGRALSLTQKKG